MFTTPWLKWGFWVFEVEASVFRGDGTFGLLTSWEGGISSPYFSDVGNQRIFVSI